LNTNHYFWFLDIQLRLQSLSDFNSYFYNPTFMSTIYLSFATTFSQWTWITAIILAFVVEFLIVFWSFKQSFHLHGSNLYCSDIVQSSILIYVSFVG
jgi:hypothetical protein